MGTTPARAQTSYALRVTRPFAFAGASYNTGDLVTDPATIAAITAGALAAFVVQVPQGAQATPLTVAVGGDASANPAPIPTAPPLLTVPVNSARRAVEIDNQSAATIQVVRDDGAGGNPSSIMLGPAAQAGGQGGSWNTTTFRGRLRVFAPAGSQVAAFED